MFQHRAHSVRLVMGRCLALVCLALLGALGIAAPVLPQEATAPCALCSPNVKPADDKPSTPVSLAVETKLDFDRLILAGAGAGSAELGPDGSRHVTGSVTALSARAMVGEVAIRGEPGREVRIDLPASIDLYGFNGGSIRVESIRSDLPPMPRLDSSGRLSFRFGGIVRIAGDADGEFRGDAQINVEYF